MTIPVPGLMLDIPSGELTSTANGQTSKTKIAAFKIDRTEVTVAAYRACVDAKKCHAPTEDKDGANENCNFVYKNRPGHPITCVSWADADDYCTYVGARLPSRDEWLYAATGGDASMYPWGHDAPARGTPGVCWSGATKTNAGLTSTCRSGSAPVDVSPFKVVDMAGNVQEWIATQATYMGGSYDVSDDDSLKPSNENQRRGPWGYNFIGFRCAK